MNEQQIDRDRLRRGAESALACGTFDAEVIGAVPQILDHLGQAEARIKAARDVLDRWQVDGYDALLRRFRRALDGDA